MGFGRTLRECGGGGREEKKAGDVRRTFRAIVTYARTSMGIDPG